MTLKGRHAEDPDLSVALSNLAGLQFAQRRWEAAAKDKALITAKSKSPSKRSSEVENALASRLAASTPVLQRSTAVSPETSLTTTR